MPAQDAPPPAPRAGDIHVVEIEGLRRDVALRPAGPTLIAYLDFLVDRELVKACARQIARAVRAAGIDVEVLLAPEAGAIPLCFLVGDELGLPHVIARKRSRDYAFGTATPSVPVQSITALQPEALVLSEEGVAALRDRRVLLLDTVLSTGSTLNAVGELARMAQARTTHAAVAFIEGTQRIDLPETLHLGRLPVYPLEA